MAMGECPAYGSLPMDSKVKFAAWSMGVDGHLSLTHFYTDDQSELSLWLCHI